MTSEPTRISLLDRLRTTEDHDAWREFDERYRELILRYCLRKNLQQADAEDVRQSVMVTLMQRLPGFSYRPDLGRFRDYLGTIVRNRILRHLTSQERRPTQLSDAEVIEHEARDVDQDWNEEWMLHHYRLAMQKVRETFSPKSLEVFEALSQGAPVEELVERHAMTPEAIYKTKQRIRDRLRECIERQLRDEDARDE